MTELKTSHPVALHFLMTEDIYGLKEEMEAVPAKAATTESIKPAAATERSEAPATEAIKPAVAAGPSDARADQQPVFDYQGENNKYILLVHHTPGQKYLPSAELDALKSILAAKKMELKDVAILNLAHYPGASYLQLKNFFACSSIVLFGVQPAALKLSDLPMNALGAQDGLRILYTFSFPDMLKDNDRKRAFWAEMKKL